MTTKQQLGLRDDSAMTPRKPVGRELRVKARRQVRRITRFSALCDYADYGLPYKGRGVVVAGSLVGRCALPAVRVAR